MGPRSKETWLMTGLTLKMNIDSTALGLLGLNPP